MKTLDQLAKRYNITSAEVVRQSIEGARLAESVGRQREVEIEFADWVYNNVVCPDTSVVGKCNRITIWRLGASLENEHLVSSLPMNLEDAGDELVDLLVFTFRSEAQKDVDALDKGRRKYEVRAFYDKNTDYKPRKILSLTPTGQET